MGYLLGAIEKDFKEGPRFRTIGVGSASTSIAFSGDKSNAASFALNSISTTPSVTLGYLGRDSDEFKTPSVFLPVVVYCLVVFCFG